jgi:hypothetical protein
MLVGACVAACVAGCGKSSDAGRFVPRKDVALQALNLSLDAWQRGSDDSALALDDGVAVEVVDQHRRVGQTLQKFTIIGEVAGDGGRWFEVELHLAEPEHREQVRYVVVGVDPLWVFRRIDYEMLSHWDHPMPEVGSDE